MLSHAATFLEFSMRTKLTIAVALLIFLTGCREFPFSMFSGNGELLAKVGKKELYKEDAAHIFTENMSPEDSAKLMKTYTDNWIKTQLKIREAEILFEKDQDDINKKIEEYRNSLLLYKYEQQYLNRFVDTLITGEQINEYYEANKDRLLLAGPIVRARVVRFPVDFRQAKKIRESFKSEKESDFLDFLDIVEKNKFKFDDFTGKWYDLNEVLRVIPFSYSEGDISKIMKNNGFYEISNSEYTYLMKIAAFKNTGETAPPETVEDIIRQTLHNRRRQELVRHKEDSLYNAGIKNKKLIINNLRNEE